MVFKEKFGTLSSAFRWCSIEIRQMGAAEPISFHWQIFFHLLKTLCSSAVYDAFIFLQIRVSIYTPSDQAQTATSANGFSN